MKPLKEDGPAATPAGSPPPEDMTQSPLTPHIARLLFLLTSLAMALWIVAMLVMYFVTVYPAERGGRSAPVAVSPN